MKKLLFIVCLALLHAGYTFSQEIITGKLIDASTQDPLPGAVVLIKGTQNGTTTALDGSFNMKRPGADPITLVLSSMGFIT
jgi:iron complex outermembrane recepter protein